MHKVKILPQEKEIHVETGSNLRESLIQNGFEIKSPCGGVASCASCIVIVKNGEENLSEISFEEQQLLGNVFHLTKERLCCQAKVNGDIEVDISAHGKKQSLPSKVIRKSKEKVATDLEVRKQEMRDRPAKEGGWKKPKSFNYNKEDADIKAQQKKEADKKYEEKKLRESKYRK
jgi:ferredoxin